MRARLITGILALLCITAPVPLTAHEIPNDVTIQAFIKPAGNHLNLLLRVPLAAMRDVNFPTTGPGYLDLPRLDTLLHDAATVWISDSIELYEDGARLPRPRVVEARPALPSDRSFTGYESAFAHITGDHLPATANLYWNQAMLDVLLEYPIHSDRAHFSIHPGLARLGLRVVTVLRFVPPATPVRAFEFSGDPGLVPLDPGWFQAASRFVELGFFHILDGADHLLFLFCLVIPFRGFRNLIRGLVPVVTAFTVAHSITLIASANNLAPNALWFPPLIETLIAVSIVFMALENIAARRSFVQHRWIVAFAFGLIHGFGFSFALRQTLQFAGSHLLTSLLSFNVGVELGQLLVLAVMIPLLDLLFRFVVAERMGIIILSALAAHTGWHWMLERWERLRQFHFEWPAVTAALLAAGVRWMFFAVLIAGLVWLVSTLLARRRGLVDIRAQAQ